jgi:hypothetical protein
MMRGRVEATMAKLANKEELLKFMGDAHAQHLKVAGFLLAAHGGSLATCATILKDSANTLQISGIGVFVLLSE